MIRATRLSCVLLLVGATGFAGIAASSENYPNKPLRIVTAAAGRGNDFVGRLIAQGLTASLGQQVIVDNRGGIAAEIVAKAPPDGYTLLFYGSATWTSPLLRDKVPYDPVKDFSPITLATKAPDIVVGGFAFLWTCPRRSLILPVLPGSLSQLRDASKETTM